MLMSDDEKNNSKKYEVSQDTFIATEEDLKKIIGEEFSVSTKEASSNYQEIVDTSDDTQVQTRDLDKISPPKDADDLETDYNYIRTNLYTITERSIDALNNLVEIADQSQHPRAYEVISLLVNTIANAQKDLMKVHTDKNKIESNEAKSGAKEIVNNNLFIGNTAELDEIISKMSKKADDE